MATDHGMSWRIKRDSRLRRIVPIGAMLAAASCVPSGQAERIAMVSTRVMAPAPPAEALDMAIVPAEERPEAVAINAVIPITTGPNPAARPFVQAGSVLDRLRAENCLAQAVYYEARSESEDGQRAVAQVVLNRVAHPSYPASVCGVVYQGPMKAGGGCQFSFTCDGSLATAPRGGAWLGARRIAGAALAGRVHAPVGLSAHYHTHAVFPHWAPRLEKAIVIGAHIFYRWPGAWGKPAAFSQAYRGREPFPVSAARTQPRVLTASLPFTPKAASPNLVPAETPLPTVALIPDRLPQSTIRPEFARSGQWKTDLD